MKSRTRTFEAWARRLFKCFACLVVLFTFTAVPALADGEPLTVVSNLSDCSGMLVRSHPINRGELIMHHIPKCVSSSSCLRPLPISSMSISL